MTVGFSVVHDGRTVTFNSHQPAGNPDHPLVTFDEGGALCAVLAGRLYYLDDLRSAIGVPRVEAVNAAALALAAYRKRGIDGLLALEGDFSLVLWDGNAGRLVALGDPTGGYPLYWTRNGPTLGLATGLRPLIEVVEHQAVDIDFLGETLMQSFAEIDYFDRTVFKNIQRLVPGTRLVYAAATGRLDVEACWDWRDHAEMPQTDDLDQIAARYRELLESAVRERLHGTVAAHVSGGMDSTSTAYLARDLRAAQGGEVHGISIVYDRLFGLKDETPFVDVALDSPGFIPHRIEGDEILDFDHFADPPLHDEPYTGFFRAGIDIALTNAAVACGADTVLTGLGADELLADAPYYLADLVRRGRLGSAWSEAGRWAGAANASTWSILGHYGLKPLTPSWLLGGISGWLRGGYATFEKQGPFTIAPWVVRNFARQARLRERARQIARQNFRSAETVVLSEVLARLRYTMGDWTRTALAAPHNLHVAHPFRDPRLIGFGLGLRMRLNPEPGAPQKVVLGKAMGDSLPARITARRGKGDFNAVYFVGLSRNLANLEAMIEASHVEELGIFRKAPLIECLRYAAHGVQQMPSLSGLNNTLAIICWLGLLPQWRARFETPALLREIPLAADAVSG